MDKSLGDSDYSLTRIKDQEHTQCSVCGVVFNNEDEINTCQVCQLGQHTTCMGYDDEAVPHMRIISKNFSEAIFRCMKCESILERVKKRYEDMK